MVDAKHLNSGSVIMLKNCQLNENDNGRFCKQIHYIKFSMQQ